MSSQPAGKLKKQVQYFILFIAIIFLTLVFRILAPEIFSIPSSSMEDTILPGDKIIVSKLAYGPRLPSSPFEIPWINLVFLLSRNQREKSDSAWWEYKRLKGFSQVKHGDIIVFDSPNNDRAALIKRCMGLPGDTLMIRQAKVYANSKEIPDKSAVKNKYRLKIRKVAYASAFFDSIGLNSHHGYNLEDSSITVNLSSTKIEELKTHDFISSLAQEYIKPENGGKTYPYSELFCWRVDSFGPVVIPARGMTVSLNPERPSRRAGTPSH